MVTTVDGATTLGGTSGGLGGPADRVVFATIRSFADVIVVGSATMQAEGYGPSRLTPPVRQARLTRGQTVLPAIAVVTRRVDVDWASSFFTDAEVPPLLITVEGAASRVPADASVGDVVLAGVEDVDLRAALDALVERGYHEILVEGGPSINGQLADLDEIDELCLTFSPHLAAGTSSRILRGDGDGSAAELELASIVTADDYLFLRYGRRVGAGRAPA